MLSKMLHLFLQRAFPGIGATKEAVACTACCFSCLEKCTYRAFIIWVTLNCNALTTFICYHSVNNRMKTLERWAILPSGFIVPDGHGCTYSSHVPATYLIFPGFLGMAGRFVSQLQIHKMLPYLRVLRGLFKVYRALGNLLGEQC